MNIYSLKIRFIFISLVLLGIIFFLKFTIFIPQMREDEIYERVKIQNNVANLLVRSMESTFFQSKNSLEKISQLPGIVSLQPENMDHILTEMNSVSQFFNYYFIVDCESNWLSYPSKPHMIGKEIANNYWVSDVLNNNKTSYLDAHLAKRVNTIVSGFVTPIHGENGNVTALLRGVLTLTDSNALLNQVRNSHFEKNGYCYLTDSKGKLLAHPERKVTAENFEKTNFSSYDPVKFALQGKEGVTEYEYQNKTWVASYRRIPSTGWILIAQQPKEEILELVSRELNEITKIFMFSFLSIMAVLVLIAHRALQPLSHLLDIIRSGQFKQKKSKSKDEISLLANEFGKLYLNLINSNKQMEEEILERKNANENLVLAKNEAEKANAVKSEFLANMSHELRTPLNGIVGFSRIVLDMELTGKQREYLSLVNQSAERLSPIVNDILDFAKIDAGKLKLEKNDFRLRETIETCIDSLKTAALSKGLGFVCRIEEAIPDNLLGDPNRITQILVNLISNAIKFTEKGEIEVLVCLKEELDKSIILLFSVRDTGIGVPEDKRVEIFESFTQADLSHSRKYGGTGLGLAISAELVKMMGGEIWLESHGGSTFLFTAILEYAAPQVTINDETDSSVLLHDFSQKLHILLAEDELINSLLATTILEDKGWQVAAVTNGQEAFEAWQSGNFDIILMDIQMPEMDGHQSTIAIRIEEEKTGQHIPIIAMTAHALGGDQEKCLQAGMDAYVAKPISQEKLYNVIIDLTLKNNC